MQRNYLQPNWPTYTEIKVTESRLIGHVIFTYYQNPSSHTSFWSKLKATYIGINCKYITRRFKEILANLQQLN